MQTLEQVYESIGRRVVSIAAEGGTIDFAAKKKGGAGKNCKKGWSCGYSCISKSKNCRNALKGQSATYADWLAKQSSGGKPKTTAKPKSGAGGAKSDSAAVTAEINKLRAKYKPIKPSEADNIAQGKPPNTPTETGEMLYRYSDDVETPAGSVSQQKLKQGFEQSTQAEAVYNGQPALVCSDNGVLKAVGEHSGNIHASALAAGGKNGRALSVQIGSSPEAIEVAKKLDVPDTNPVFFKMSRDPRAFDQGEIYYLYASDITKPSKSKGHKGSEKDIDEAAIAVLKSNVQMPAPVVVRQIGVGKNARYEVIGGNFAYDVAQRAQLERYYAVIAEVVPD